ncbi:hypothetical protein QTQ03_17000 [Micromonospora sp. WMMA1363]|uniref:hypothetical protein n=1 Tax=Micromonospora sp. WMMA1363 TaxID=3053985 RepID=UPI00259CC4D7|nr:hypothetical protein [Micromonospora sp. WMMA1363]MDM4721215.1 hypothetical protein [Micromonospora sp. WMMA1363]
MRGAEASSRVRARGVEVLHSDDVPCRHGIGYRLGAGCSVEIVDDPERVCPND